MNARTVTLTLPDDRSVRVLRVFDAPRRLVWRAHLEADLVKRWMSAPEGCSLTRVEIDGREGGTFRYDMRDNATGETTGWGGRFLELSPYDRMVHTELFDEDWTGGETTVVTLLRELPGEKTELEVTLSYASKEARDGVLETDMSEVMNAAYEGLDALLASGGAA